MSSSGKDDFDVIKIFPDDKNNPMFYAFKIGTWEHDDGDRDHFPNRKYTSCGKPGEPCEGEQGSPECSVLSTEWEKEGIEFVDQEVTAYFFLPEIESNDDKKQCYKYSRGGKGSGIAIKLRGSRHDDDDNSARTYIFDFQYEGDDVDANNESNNFKSNNFQKEFPHPEYYKMTVPTNFKLKQSIGKWVGYKVVTVNQDNGVRCVAFVDYGSYDRSKEEGPDLDAQDWVIYYDIFDDGKLDERNDIIMNENDRDKYKHKQKVRKAWREHNGHQVTQFRMDRIVKPEAKFLSARRISGESVEDILEHHLPHPNE